MVANVQSVVTSDKLEGQAVTFSFTLDAHQLSDVLFVQIYASAADLATLSFTDGVTWYKDPETGMPTKDSLFIPAGVTRFSVIFSPKASPKYEATRDITVSNFPGPNCTAHIYDQAVVTKISPPMKAAYGQRIQFDVSVKPAKISKFLAFSMHANGVTISKLKFTNGIKIAADGNRLVIPAGTKAFTIFATPEPIGLAAEKVLMLFLGSDALSKNSSVIIQTSSQTAQTVDTLPPSASGQVISVLVFDQGAASKNGGNQSNLPLASSQAASFASLSLFDVNHDGLIDLKDPQWQNFAIWRDTNRDGAFQKNERETLAQQGIAALDLRAGVATINDNLVHGFLPVLKNDGSAAIWAIGARFFV